MQIQVNTDNHTQGRAELIRQVEDVVESSLGRFGDRITRVEVHLRDENGRSKSGNDDKRCVMEARLAGLQPITVSAESSSMNQALDGAARKLEKTLRRTLERLDDPKGRTSFAGDPSDAGQIP
jgi:ribosomal subunit interface protein